MITEILKQMMKEEWRLHSELFSGRSFSLFPLIILGISSMFAFLFDFSTVDNEAVNQGLGFLGIFLGLSVGSIGFSSRDALKNVLGPVSFLVYSSRTLPVSEKTLVALFLLKDVIYYGALFLAPISLGFAVVSGGGFAYGALLLFAGFLLGLGVSVAAARLSLNLPGLKGSYRGRFSPLSDKTVVDLFRSSGGILKVVFSLTILSGFYWFAVLYFPMAGSFLTNPLLSFSALLGIVSLSVYNWINRFDSFDDYIYLPVEKSDLIRAKQEAFLIVSVPLVSLYLLIPALYYTVSIEMVLLAFATSLAVQLYTLGASSLLTGLKPNSRLFDSFVFLKFGTVTLLAVLPLLLFSVLYGSSLLLQYLVMVVLVFLAGLAMIRKAI